MNPKKILFSIAHRELGILQTIMPFVIFSKCFFVVSKQIFLLASIVFGFVFAKHKAMADIFQHALRTVIMIFFIITVSFIKEVVADAMLYKVLQFFFSADTNEPNVLFIISNTGIYAVDNMSLKDVIKLIRKNNFKETRIDEIPPTLLGHLNIKRN